MSKVAVIGGGFTGSVCSTLLRRAGLQVQLIDRGAHGLGGRASSKSLVHGERLLSFDQGAQFALCSDRRFEMLAESPLLKGIITEWAGRLVVVGGNSGATITRDAVRDSGLMQPDKDGKHDSALLPMNFCGFVEGSSTEHKLYHSVRGFGGVCSEMVQRAGVEVRQNTTVRGAKLDEHGTWHVAFEDEPTESFDTLVLANNDPVFAADVIEQQMARTRDPELSNKNVQDTVGGFCQGLRGMDKQSRFTIMAALDTPYDTPWDAAAVHGSGVLQFVSRGQLVDGAQCWVAHSTAEFAEFIDSNEARHEQAISTALRPMLDALLDTLGSGATEAEKASVEPCFVQVRRWGNGFYGQTLSLNPPNESHNDAVTFRQLSLALCGDYLGERQNIQSAAISAMCAADRIVGWTADDTHTMHN